MLVIQQLFHFTVTAHRAEDLNLGIIPNRIGDKEGEI